MSGPRSCDGRDATVVWQEDDAEYDIQRVDWHERGAIRAALKKAASTKVSKQETTGKRSVRQPEDAPPCVARARARLRIARASGLRLKLDKRLAAEGINESDLWGR
jgi:hypothetical protein